jgi:4-hydroxy-3-methylbut-2-en-1-yl diphosphate reductase
MKNIIVADDQGFCWGVRRALDIVYQHGNVLIFGDLIHNKQVVKQLEKKGKKIIHQVSGEEKDPIVITAHGTTIKNIERFKQLNLNIVDTTCPLVSKIYKVGKLLEDEGYRIVIIGDKHHVEVKGIASRMKDPIIVKDEEEVHEVSFPDRIGIICQSTFSLEKFDKIAQQIKLKVKDIRIRNTTCSPTRKRQESAASLAQKVELMIVVGGYHSSNTKKLKEITSRYVESHHIETADQLKREWLENKTEIGITSGASTPDWIVDEICHKIRETT